MNQVKEEKLESSLYIKGWSGRTTNQDEMGGQGIIPQLWQKFNEETAEDGPKMPVCAYHSFEADHLGPYTASVGYLVEEEKADVTVPAGTYLRFQAQGNGMEEIMGLWQQVWNYPFEEKGYTRAYMVDLEEYGQSDCSVWIGVSKTQP